jgi:ABC-type lipoprotein export system ATPase subunit
MVTHDKHVASLTERMLLLSNGKIAKEKEGHLSTKKNQQQTANNVDDQN